MIKVLFIFFGTIFILIGLLGIFIPGLPTTPFLLLSAYLYFKASKRLYNWLLNNRITGPYIKNYREHRAIPLRIKIISLLIKWIMIAIAVLFIIEDQNIKLIIIGVGLVGTIILLVIPTLKKRN